MCQQRPRTQNDALDQLSGLMEQELRAMAQNVAANYEVNMANRGNNPFLAFSDRNIEKYMALGRSVDSQLGNRLQRIIFYIARMRFGQLQVPNLVELNVIDPNSNQRKLKCILNSVPVDLEVTEQNRGFNPYKQVICVQQEKTERQVKRLLKIKETSDALQRAEFEFTQIPDEVLKILQQRSGKTVPVDLLFFDCAHDQLNRANTFEIKMGGNLDTKNAKSNAEEVKTLLNLFAFLQQNESFFATCYGTCSHAVEKEVREHIGRDGTLNGEAFWEKIIPDDQFSYREFIEAFQKAFAESGLEEQLDIL